MRKLLGREHGKDRSASRKRQDESAATLGPTASSSSLAQERIGLLNLYSGPEVTVDVVAVHGLQGDPFKTWKHENGKLWLRDFLPADVPFARIMSYGYESTVAFSSSVANIEDIALDLLNRLVHERSIGANKRPIVFICHSLGGLVVKKALVLAHEQSSLTGCLEILASTKAVAFLGVPHKGSDTATWAKVAADALKAASVYTTTNSALVDALRKDSTDLIDISKQFAHRTKDLDIYTFYETQKLHGKLIVEKESARIGLPNEKLFPMESNHKTICKIPSATSQQYAMLYHNIVRLVKSYANPTTETLCVYFHVPNRLVKSFIGRENILKDIDLALTARRHARIAVLQGMGGQGKSQTALEYCRRYRNRPFSAIFWVDATTESAAIGSFHSISEIIKSPANHFYDTEARVEFVLEKLATWETDWLLIFDNYDDPADFPNVQNYFPCSPRGAILITSRSLESQSLVAHNDVGFVQLQGLEEEAALQLLYTKSGIKHQNLEQAKEIIERLGSHPLALTQAGAYIKKRNLDFSKFLEHYSRRKREILDMTPQVTQYTRRLADEDKETALNVFTTWELSAEQLVSRSRGDEIEIRLLTMLAFFHRNNVPEVFFGKIYQVACQMVESTSASLRVDDRAQRDTEESKDKDEGYDDGSDNADIETNNGSKNLWTSDTLELIHWLGYFKNRGEWDKDAFEDTLLRLNDLSLLQTCTRNTDGFYHTSLHPLVQDWLRLRLSISDCQRYTIAAALLVADVLQKTCKDEQVDMPLSSKNVMLLHLRMQERNFENYLEDKVSPLTNETIHLKYLTTQSLFSWFSGEMGDLSTAERLVKRAVDQRKLLLGTEHISVLKDMTKWSRLILGRGRYNEAEAMAKTLVSSFGLTVGLESEFTLEAKDLLRETLQFQGRYKESAEIQKQVMKQRRELQGAESVFALVSMSRLAWTLHALGSFIEAENTQVHVVAKLCETINEEDQRLLEARNILALIKLSVGRIDEAEKIQVEVTEIQKRQLPSDHPDLLLSLNNLASIYIYQHRLKEAEQTQLSVLEVMERVLGLEHPDTLIARNSLAITYTDLGRLDEAERMQLSVLEAKERVLGLEHPNTLTAKNNLAMTYVDLGRLDEAEGVQLSVLEARERELGLEHPNTLIARHNLALTYRHLGRLDKAERMQLSVLEVMERVLGLEHPDTLKAKNNLALTYVDLGRLDKAEGMQLSVWKQSKRLLGSEHPDTLARMHRLAMTYSKLGEQGRARRLMSETFRGRQKVLGTEHPATKRSQEWLDVWAKSREQEHSEDGEDECLGEEEVVSEGETTGEGNEGEEEGSSEGDGHGRGDGKGDVEGKGETSIEERDAIVPDVGSRVNKRTYFEIPSTILGRKRG
ncbi:MAG: hypothetical protein Q9190_000045 [Brigantiaea leucoxantha]